MTLPRPHVLTLSAGGGLSPTSSLGDVLTVLPLSFTHYLSASSVKTGVMTQSPLLAFMCSCTRTIPDDLAIFGLFFPPAFQHFQTMLKSKLNVLTLKKEPLPAVIFHEPEAIELCTTTPLMKSRTHSGCKVRGAARGGTPVGQTEGRNMLVS